ncbi:MAG: hypothetical protein IJT23_11615 [Clostridia bacterium]|nr:hypothetical protein [Clostridia bacterium]
MKYIICMGIAFILGAMFGLIVICCCIMAGREDRELEKLNKYKADTE